MQAAGEAAQRLLLVEPGTGGKCAEPSMAAEHSMQWTSQGDSLVSDTCRASQVVSGGTHVLMLSGESCDQLH